MVEWGGHHGGWGGFGPPSYIVKKCPATVTVLISQFSWQAAPIFTFHDSHVVIHASLDE